MRSSPPHSRIVGKGGANLENVPLDRRGDRQRRAGPTGDDAVELGVRSPRIMMEEDQPPRSDMLGKPHGVIDTGVPEVRACGELFARVLRIVQQQVNSLRTAAPPPRDTDRTLQARRRARPARGPACTPRPRAHPRPGTQRCARPCGESPAPGHQSPRCRCSPDVRCSNPHAPRISRGRMGKWGGDIARARISSASPPGCSGMYSVVWASGLSTEGQNGNPCV